MEFRPNWKVLGNTLPNTAKPRIALLQRVSLAMKSGSTIIVPAVRQYQHQLQHAIGQLVGALEQFAGLLVAKTQ